MTHREPTVRSRELGAGLRQAMQDAGLNGKQAARLLDVTPGYVSLLLSGKRGASELDLDSQTACLFLEEPEEIAAYQHILKVMPSQASSTRPAGSTTCSRFRRIRIGG